MDDHDLSSMAERHILMFSKYFGYNLGGAERSMLALLQSEEKKGARITALVVDGLESYGASAHRMALPNSWDIVPFRMRADIVRFRYLAYAANRSAILRYFRQHDPGATLYTYGQYAPAAILGYRGPSVYFVRDEYGLGWDENYEAGWKRWAKEAYRGVQWPWRSRWLSDLRLAMRKARLVANSRFIARGLEQMVPGASVEIAYPQIDCDALRMEYRASLQRAQRQGVVMVGNNRLKGTDVLLRVARKMPDQIFYVFDRDFATPKRKGNVVFMPWCTVAGDIYSLAKVVMVPSRCAEAFPRMVLEAQCLGIPVVASDRGGIPEAMTDKTGLVGHLEDIDEWRERLRVRL